MLIFMQLIYFFVLLAFTTSFELEFSADSQDVLQKLTDDATSLKCKISQAEVKAEDVVFEWYKDGKPSRLATLGNKKNELFFPAPTLEDSGNYTCVAKARANEDLQRNKTIRLEFIKKPRFRNEDNEQHPEEGKDAKIYCNAENARSETFWRFKNAVLSEGGPRGYRFEDDGQILHIPNFEAKRDDGIYECYVPVPQNFIGRNITVTAYFRPILPPLVGPENNVAFEGEAAVELKCQAAGKPAPTYTWKRIMDDGKEIEVKGSDKYVLDNGLLRIRSVIPSDQGTYACIAANPLDKVSEKLTLRVISKPKIERMRNLTRDKGEKVELKCVYSGDGVIKAKWVHFGREFPEEENAADEGEVGRYENGEAKKSSELASDDGPACLDCFQDERISVKKGDDSLSLIIDGVREDDSGGYQCVAENDAGRDQNEIFLFINQQPTITSPNEPQRVLRGKSVILSCEASAFPDPEWTWLDNKNKTITPDGETIRIYSHTITSKLMLSRVAAENFGTYTCIAENGIGTPARSEIEVVEIITPDVPTNVRCNENLYPNYATCEISSYNHSPLGKLPTNLTFQYAEPHEDFSDNQVVNREFDTNVESKEFTIGSLKPETRYKLQISAANEAGTSGFSETVYVETSEPRVPEMPAEVQVTCNKTCFVDWTVPNDMGSEILKYRIQLTELRDAKAQEEADEQVQEREVDATPSTEADLGQLTLKPSTTYKVSVSAINSKGEGAPQERTFTTSARTSTQAQARAWGSTNLVLAIAFILLFLLFVVDLVCFATNRCGIIACFCTKCLGRNYRTVREKDIEQCNSSREEDKPVRKPHSTPV